MSQSKSKRRRAAKPETSAPVAEPVAWSLPSPKVVLLVLGIGAVVAAGIYRYRVGQDPMLRMPALNLVEATPSVAQIISAAHREVVQHPHRAQAWGDLGVALLTHEYRDEAVACFAEAGRLDPKTAEWAYYRGMSLAKSDQEQALEAFQLAHQIDPKSTVIRLRLAEWLYDMNRHAESLGHYDAVLADDANNPRAQLGKARVLLATNRVEESRDWAEKAVASAPQRRDVRELLARIYGRMGLQDRAAEQADLLRTIPLGFEVWHDPYMVKAAQVRKDVTFLSMQARQLAARGRYAESIRVYQELIGLQPQNPEWKLQMAQTFWQAGQTERAAALLDQSIPLFPQAPELVVLRGRIDLAEGNAETALERFRLAARVKRDYDQAFFQLGLALQTLNRHEDAVVAFAEASTLQPNFAPTYERAARSFVELNKPSEAIAQLRMAVRYQPLNVSALRQLASLLENAGETDEAKQLMERAKAAAAAQDPTK